MTLNFSSERVRLTSFVDDDLPQLAEWLSDFGLQRLVNPGMSVPITAADLQNPDGWFQSDLKNKNSRVFAVRTLADNIFIGSSALVEVNMFTHSAEIGINLSHPDYRGKGFGTEVMMLTMQYGFEQLNLNRIFLKVMGYNERAIRLYERLGFVHETRNREMLFHDGHYYDELMMGILRDEWETLYG